MTELPQYQKLVAPQQPAPFQAPDVQSAGQSVAARLMQFAGTGVTVAAKMNKEDLASEMAQTTVTMRQNFERILTQVSNNPSPTSGQEFPKLFAASIKGQRSSVSSGNINKFNELASEYALRGSLLTATQSRAISKNIAQENAIEALDARKKDAFTAARKGDVFLDKKGNPIKDKDGNPIPTSAKPVSDINDGIKMAVDNGLFSGAFSANYHKAVHDGVEEQHYLGQFDRVLQKGDPEKVVKYLEQFHKNQQIDPLIKSSLMPQFKKLEAQSMTESGMTTSSLKEDAKGFNQLIRDGKMTASDPKILQMLDRMRFAGSKGIQAVKNQLIISQQFHHYAALANSKTQAEMTEIINHIDKVKTTNPQDAFIQAQLKTQLVKFMNDRRAKLDPTKKTFDPVSVYENDPAVRSAMKARQLAAHDENGDKTQGNQPVSVNPLQVLWDLQKDIPTNKRSIVNNSTAKDIIRQLNSIRDENGNPDMNGKIKYLDQLADKYGKFTVALNRDLNRNGAPHNVMDLVGLEKISGAYLDTIYRAYSDPQSVKKNLAIHGKYTFSELQKQADSKLKDLFATFPQSPETEKVKNEMIENVALASAQWILDGHTSGIFSGNNATDTMYKALYGNRYSTIIDKATIPFNVTKENGKAAMYAMEKNIPNVEFNSLTRAPGGIKLTAGEIKTEDMDIIKDGHWMTASGDTGLYWVDANGFTPTIKGTKQRYELHWDDLDDPTSELNNTIAKHPGVGGLIGDIFNG